MRYEEPAKPRFRIEQDGAQEWVRIPARRQWFALPFLAVWLTMWTAAGVAVFYQMAAEGHWVLAVWLIFWALGWVFAAGTVIWQIGGAEKLSVSGGDLQHVVQMPGYRKLRVYRGGEMKGLRSVSTGWPSFYPRGVNYPPLFNFPYGAIQFRYGARTIHLAPGTDEAEAAMIVDRLKTRLPAGVEGDSPRVK